MEPNLYLQSDRVALIRARWHSEIVDMAVTAFLDTWKGLENSGPVDVMDVPGALEIPLHAQLIATTKRYKAIVCCAFVVNGGIYRHDFVAGTVLDSIMRVQLAADIPVLSAILTPHHFQESEVQINFFKDHFVLKGSELAIACRSIIDARHDLLNPKK